MALRLSGAAYPLIVYNRTKGKEEPLTAKGASVASSPAELIKKADIVIMMVSDDNAARELFTGGYGLLQPEGLGGKIIINMSTVSSTISMEMAGLCHQKGLHYLDAPVSGSVKQAQNGELVIMAGGEEEIFRKAKPVFDQLGKLAVYAGKTGSGNTMKLAVNVLLAIISQGLSESVIFCKNNGLEIGDLLNVIQNSALGNVYMKIKGEAILQNNYQAAFALKHIVKDLRLARDAGFNTPLGATALDSFAKAEPSLAEEDIISVIKSL